MKAQTQKGHLYRKNSSWHVRWRELERQPDGTINQVNRSQKLANVFDYPQKREVQPLFMEFYRQTEYGWIQRGCKRDCLAIF